MATILDILQSHGIPCSLAASTHGGEYAGPCPFCGGRDRFRVWPEQREGRGAFWCRQCGKNGDRIDLVRLLEGLDFRSAAMATGDEDIIRNDMPSAAHRQRKPSGGGAAGGSASGSPPGSSAPEPGLPMACTHRNGLSYVLAVHGDAESVSFSPIRFRIDSTWSANGKVPSGSSGAPAQHGGHADAADGTIPGPGTPSDHQGLSASAVDPALWRAKATALVQWAAPRLTSSPGRTVLAGKGLGDGACHRYSLGYIPEDVYRPRANWGLAEKRDAAGRAKKLWLPSGIVIPLIDPSTPGDAIVISRLRIRRATGEPRYYVVPGSSSRQMVLRSVSREAQRVVLVVESELDAMLLHDMMGQTLDVVALGSAQVRPDAGASSVLSSASVILLALDADEAGEKACAWWRAQAAFRSRIRRIIPPAGKDPGEAFALGADLVAWIARALPEGLRGRSDGRECANPLLSADPAAEATPSAITPAVSAPDQEDEIESRIRRLVSLLLRHPAVCVRVSPERIWLDAPDGWVRNHDRVFSEMSRLVFFDPLVMAWVDGIGRRTGRVDAGLIRRDFTYLIR